MLENMFWFTRVTLLNFNNANMIAAPVLAFIALLALRLLLGDRQPCKALMVILPIAFMVLGVFDAYLTSLDNINLVGLMLFLMRMEPSVLFGWLGLLAGTLIAKVLPKKNEEETA